MKINLNKYNKLKIYNKDGKQCYLDNLFYSKKLRLKTPEEEVRQKIIRWLLDELNVPNNMIKVEESLSHYNKNELKRADICIYYKSELGEEVLCVIECKRSEKILDDDVFTQCKFYAEKIKCPFFALTNGNEILLYKINNRENITEIVDLDTFPKYNEFCMIDNLRTKAIEPYKHNRVYNEYLSSFELQTILFNKEYIGSKTSMVICPIVAKLIDIIYDDNERLEHLDIKYYKFISDIGIRYTSFGNSSGGSWDGFYRSFVIKDRYDNSQIISIGILVSNNEHTYLNVAIDNFEKSHNSIQINLDKYLSLSNREVILSHDGSMTKGKNGAVKRDIVRNYIKDNSDLIIRNNQILLCKFYDKNIYSINDKNLQSLLSNLICYALLRDDLRNSI